AAGGAGAPAAAPRERGWIARLAGYCWHYKRNVVLAVSGTLVVSAVGITIPLIQRAIVDNLTSSGHAAVWPLAVALIGAALANFIGVYVRRYRGGRLSPDVQHEMRPPLIGSLSPLGRTPPDQPPPPPGPHPPHPH